MPLLVAQQWPVLRRAPAAISTLWRPLRGATLATITASGAYKQQPKPQGKITRSPKPPYSSIIIPATVTCPPSVFKGNIRTLPRNRRTKETLCVVFVTPAFAHYLTRDDSFLDMIINVIYSTSDLNPEQMKTCQVRAVCAVVDKLPVSTNKQAGTTAEGSQATNDGPKAQTVSWGFEGIAYATFLPTSSLGSKVLSSTEHGSIEFLVREQFTDDGIDRDFVRLPLANTVFQTGIPYTMMESEWKPRADGGPLELASKRNIGYQCLRIPGLDPSRSHVEASVSIPLVPLTVPRNVEGCMGNIIRRIVGAGGKSVTASSELEDVVPRYFKSRGEPAQATTAWALVVPQRMRDSIVASTRSILERVVADRGIDDPTQVNLWDLLWRSDPPVWSSIVPQAVANGARLHRVLSGGGGWGKKAGILSLDPVPVTRDAESASSAMPASILDDPEDFASTLTPVVRDGDSIQFFVTPSTYLATEAGILEGAKRLEQSSKSNFQGWQLGTVPSTMDSIPGQSWQHSSPVSKTVYLHNNSFGALAEGGLTFTRRSASMEDDSSQFRLLHASMIDVPFSSFRAVTMVEPENEVQEDVW